MIKKACDLIPGDIVTAAANSRTGRMEPFPLVSGQLVVRNVTPGSRGGKPRVNVYFTVYTSMVMPPEREVTVTGNEKWGTTYDVAESESAP